MIHKFLLLAFVVTLPLFAKDYSRADIKGHVRDSESGETLPYANITVYATTRGATTNIDGYFVLVNEPVDTLRLVVQYIGYETQTIHVVNKVGGIEALDIRLQPKVLEIGGISVMANAEMLASNDELSQVTLSPRTLSALPNGAMSATAAHGRASGRIASISTCSRPDPPISAIMIAARTLTASHRPPCRTAATEELILPPPPRKTTMSTI